MNNQAAAGNLVAEPHLVCPAQSRLRSSPVLTELNYECFAGISPHITELKQFIAAQSMHEPPALLIGERGLRQEQIARALHQASELRDAPFIAVNVHSLHVEALNELLFSPRGLIATCQRGVIYLNELTGLPLLLQQRFAVHLEERRWYPPAQTSAQPRLVFATEFNPAQLCTETRIAFGLIELLRPWSITLKPLRERSEDIPYLARHLVERISRRNRKGTHTITAQALQLLTEYAWQANIDELEAVLESAMARTQPREVSADLLPTRIQHAALRSIPMNGINLPQLVDDFERDLIETALGQVGGQQAGAAKLLGLRVQTLNMKLKRLGRQKKQLSK